MSSEDEVVAPPVKAASNPWKVISLVLLVLVLVAGAGGAGFWWSRRGGATVEAKAAPVQVTPATAHGIVALKPFLVNLADPGGQRFLRTTIQLVVPTSSQASDISNDDVTLMRVRSAILELLTQQQAATLVTPAGKQALKRAIKDRVSKILEKVPVVDVLFSDFVVQF